MGSCTCRNERIVTGPPIPRPAYAMAAEQYNDGLVIMGGAKETYYLKTSYYYDLASGWRILNKLSEPKKHATAVAVDGMKFPDC